MTALKGKVALITGASAGIGEAIARKLVELDMKVVGCARNKDNLTKLSTDLNKSGPGKFFPVKCDVTKESDILEMFKFIENKFGTTHACINNAGLAHDAPILSGKTKDWRNMFEINVIGLCVCTREAYKLMEKAKVNDGHFVLMNSVVGHQVDLDVYSATKFSVTALTEILRKELREKKSRIRVTSISPGLVNTDFLAKYTKGDEKLANQVIDNFGWLNADDIAGSVVYALQSPLQMDVHDIIIKSNN